MARVKHSSQISSPTAGFTLIEVLVVAIMIGILSAIAAPSWLAFTNRQRVNKVNDLVLSAVREAQTEAKRTKRSYSLWFRKSTNSIDYAVVSADVAESSINNNMWKSLGKDVGVNSAQFVMRTNITTNNIAGAASTSNEINAAKKYITFDYMGALSIPKPDFGKGATGSEGSGLRFVVAIPKAANSTEPGVTKRCVIVQNLLGGMRTDKDDNCTK